MIVKILLDGFTRFLQFCCALPFLFRPNPAILEPFIISLQEVLIPMPKYILALDQGTTSSRAILFDDKQNIAAVSQKEFTQLYPKEGWVEHNPMEIWSSQYAVMMEVIAQSNIRAADLAAIGITNQRETTILWDRETGMPIYNAIVWQCRRTAPIVDGLVAQGLTDHIRQTTGLLPDAYFSATKIRWILDHVDGAQERAEKGEILFGTVDSWLLWKLTGGAVHATDVTNASRTMLFDIHKLDWDDTLLKALNIPRAMLPEVRSSSEIYGYTEIQGVKVPIAGMAGDQQAALFGQTCFDPGDAKNTYGTGCFLLMNTGDTPCESKNGLVTTIAVGLGGKVQYALEGSVFVGGAVIQWLRDEMRLFSESRDAEYYAQKVPDNGGVYLVPAFTGLGAPNWDMHARGCIVGITRGTRREHIIRAAQESIAYQVADLVKAMEADTGLTLSALKADGGASRDRFLMQFQADIIGCQVRRPVIRETTALGAAYLAGLAVGVWKNRDELRSLWNCEIEYDPAMEPAQKEKLLHQWHRAVQRSLAWEEE
jgi:glycerol kinase